jgi:hypothetical protein
MSAGLGGLPARRPDQRITGTSRAGVGPAPSNIGFFREVIISGPTGLLLVYSPTVGPGNLIAAIAGANGNAPPSGNPFVQGLGTYNEPADVATVLNGGNIAWYYDVAGGRQYAFTAPQQLAPPAVAPALRLGVGTGLMLGSNGSQADSIIFVVPSGDVSGATDASNLVNALSLTSRVFLIGGTYHVNSTITVPPGGVLTSVSRTHAVLNFVGTGDCIRMSGTGSSSPIAGELKLTVDGSGAGPGSAGFHLGDMFQLEIDIGARNFTGAGSIGVWFDNQQNFTEQITGKVYATNCASHVVFDNSTGTSLSAAATGSFDRAILDVYVDTDGQGDAVRLQNGAFIIDGRVGIYGNMSGGSAQYACLTITGSNAGGSSLISQSTITIGVELIAGGIAPYTINFGTAGQNVITDCNGLMDFAAHAAFASANNFLKSFQFDGPVYGDPDLQRSTSLGRQPFNDPALGNGGLINTRFTGLTRTASQAADTTDMKLEGFNPDNWRDVTVMNPSDFSMTFDIPANSEVADGTDDVIQPNTAATFHWDVDEGRWFRVCGTPSRVTQFTSADIPITTVTLTTNPIVSGPVQAATYRIHGIIHCTQGAVGVSQNFAFAGPGISLNRMSLNFQQIGLAGVVGGTWSWETGALGGAIASPVFIPAATFDLIFDGLITFSAAGAFTVQAAEGTTGDSFTVNAASFMDLEPVPG